MFDPRDSTAGDAPWGSSLGPEYWNDRPEGHPGPAPDGAAATSTRWPVPEWTRPVAKERSDVSPGSAVDDAGSGASTSTSTSTQPNASADTSASTDTSTSTDPIRGDALVGHADVLAAELRRLVGQVGEGVTLGEGGGSARVPSLAWMLDDMDLLHLVDSLDTVATLALAGIATAAAEALDRGLVHTKDARSFLVEHAPGLRDSGAGSLARFLDESGPRVPSVLSSDTAAPGEPGAGGAAFVGDRDAHRALVRAAVLTGYANVCEGRAILAGMDRVMATVPDAPGASLPSPEELNAMTDAERDEALERHEGLEKERCFLETFGRTGTTPPSLWEGVAAGMLRMARHGVRELRKVAPQAIAIFAAAGRVGLEQREDVARRHRTLSAGHEAADGLVDYRLTLDVEAALVLENAMTALAAPTPSEAGPDLRSSDQRRGDALHQIITTAVAATSPQGSRGAKTQLILTMSLTDLLAERGAATTLGAPDAGSALSASAARRLACEAEIIPAVLGTDSALLDLGRSVRLFTGHTLAAIRLRDRGCTFPGCSIPAKWADAHHLVHWADGGRTDPSNAALLCERHHTVVHSHRYAGHVDEREHRVVWDTRRGSYDDYLRRRPDSPPGASAGRDERT